MHHRSKLDSGSCYPHKNEPVRTSLNHNILLIYSKDMMLVICKIYCELYLHLDEQKTEVEITLLHCCTLENQDVTVFIMLIFFLDCMYLATQSMLGCETVANTNNILN